MPLQKAARLSPAVVALLAGLLSSIPAAQAEPRWTQLPPTPSLPEAARSGHVLHNGARLWYATFGDARAPAVLLLHGGGADSAYWGHLVRELSRAYHLVVMDSRGHGRSTNEAAAITYEQMAQDAVAVLDHLAIGAAAIVGWSDGANTGFHLALQYPDRVPVLLAFAGNATPAGYQPSTNPAVTAAYFARTRREYETLSPQPERLASVMNALSIMWKTQPSLTAKDLRAIRARTAIFHAEHDEIIRRSHSEEIAARIPGSKFVLLRGVSHFALLQDPERFNEAVRAFLAGQ